VVGRQSGQLPPVTVRLDRPSVARVYNYYLGGTTNWAVDREFGDRVLDQFPIMRHIATIHRQFLGRAVRHLSALGIRQFLDVGSGIPAAGATHEIADACGGPPDTRVLYVDNDPVAVAHGEVLLNSNGDPRRHVMIEADLRDPDALWRQVIDTQLFDRSEPVALLLIALLHLQQRDVLGNEIGPRSVARLCARLPKGSYVALSHATDEEVEPDVSAALAGLKEIYDAAGDGSVTWRSRAEISAMLDGLDILDPGWTFATEWHAEDTELPAPDVSLPPSSNLVVWAGVGRK